MQLPDNLDRSSMTYLVGDGRLMEDPTAWDTDDGMYEEFTSHEDCYQAHARFRIWRRVNGYTDETGVYNGWQQFLAVRRSERIERAKIEERDRIAEQWNAPKGQDILW